MISTRKGSSIMLRLLTQPHRRKALRQQIMRTELWAIAADWRLPRKIIRWATRLMSLAASGNTLSISEKTAEGRFLRKCSHVVSRLPTANAHRGIRERRA